MNGRDKRRKAKRLREEGDRLTGQLQTMRQMVDSCSCGIFDRRKTILGQPRNAWQVDQHAVDCCVRRLEVVRGGREAIAERG